MAEIQVENLKVVYRGVILALQGVSLRAGAGEAVALLGPNGAGKSTLVRSLAGLLPQYDGRVLDGRILLNGQESHHLPALKVASLGLTAILEGRPIFRYLTVVENLRAAGHKLPPERQKAITEEIFTRFPRLYERRFEQGGYLSGGEQQMLLLGMALLTEPKILVVDEPSLGLSPKLTEEVMRVLDELRRDKGLTLLLVEQNAKAAFSIVERVYVMEQGRIVFEGTSQEAQADADVMEFYLGGAAAGGFAEAKRYRRRKRWV
ncbi:MAG: ABC transporter ATP-binding protein [Meiothermus sp.]|uniref:ABC transporter ATP-binding protein n=1 Tax=Meiothermus sp. TaxID=1955249 RepID=UPI0025FAB193|nr:ABC transporter ATP-binding protein [Meiothermus sp.]MCS7057443.1 ABC transporter ATP-binding protein [Meiothermus sp.]MCS7193551.1 ABC transporter ATP-binding protein [Meiothermus sp.]MCX7739992.1 ABC transporter ATP-binding protein [Meiothermus sp.]MDW8091602.1 ABC transporter ATP-binding protein [Meiothermus sp.]MDW8481528.1 ABC transporter ATP-binding protein [Meiothermus sp.]